jgi:AraC family transcriptional regulator, regulatory protein of adaptative response / methylphosphotriester-DNA alkyltransferase methyltransferase
MEPELFQRIYQSIANKESTYDGIYYTGVRTTRIVCRPSCRARTPKPENITLYTSFEDAVRSGFRPCKRCKPETPGAHAPDAALAAEIDAHLAAHMSRSLTLESLAAAHRISPYHLQRTYKRVRGCSPAERLAELRLAAAKRMLLEEDKSMTMVSEAIGYRSASHFAAWFRRVTGMAPSVYREQQPPRKAGDSKE